MSPLPQGEVHVWSIPLDVTPATHEHYRNLITAEELEQANRFVFQEHGRRYAVAHAALRVILSEYTETKGMDITFEKSPHGKPQIPSLSFNLSHSHEMALLGIAAKGDLGIDIEFAKENRDMDLIVEKTFSEPECQEYQKIPKDLKSNAFYTGWTRKEAFIKACGKGLSCDLKSFAVPMRPDISPYLRFLKDGTKQEKNWSIRDLPAPQNYFAALVWDDQITKVQFFSFPDRLK